MFIKIKKNQGIYMQHNGVDKRHIVPVTSNFLINLDQVAEASFYTLKETKKQIDLEGHTLELPMHTAVVHLQMSYLYALYTEDKNGRKGRMAERQYYKLFFRPENVEPYQELRSVIESQVANL
ncbi:hypothetical protein [Nitrincola tapanii]|jgi:hypothetical protein|uniref:Uncharacterized protein n=1 Tax=Nitrincola tapanii TaxID=1708751 RepID=A0A5A9W4L7_9GAMM|nr:hypothetical protein [Nitrincola tapanii]KAA0875716.1 hypothetical protein E1H14_03210 [Nitrincola tapanii]